MRCNSAALAHKIQLSLIGAILLGMTATIAMGPAQADGSGGTRICDGRYVLCSSAQCRRIPGDPTHVTCSCEGPLNGLNIGDSSCQSRTEKPTSTFSLYDLMAASNRRAKVPVSCSGANANTWAFCLDAPCIAAKGGVSCTCKVAPASDYTVFAVACPKDKAALEAVCTKIWSSASQAELTSGYSQLTPFYGNPPKLTYCPKK